MAREQNGFLKGYSYECLEFWFWGLISPSTWKDCSTIFDSLLYGCGIGRVFIVKLDSLLITVCG
jgi:hypothetical protein